MILHCGYEELQALTKATESALSGFEGGGVAAPPEVVGDMEALLPRLVGDVSISTYAEQQSVEAALAYVCDHLREHMDSTILAEYVGSENAVIAFFDYGHVLSILDRVLAMGEEMYALIELMTGESPTTETARSVTFPD